MEALPHGCKGLKNSGRGTTMFFSYVIKRWSNDSPTMAGQYGGFMIQRDTPLPAGETIVMTAQNTLVQVGICLLAGVLLGILAKYSDAAMNRGVLGPFWQLISDTTTRLGIWIVLATLLAAYSRSPCLAAIRVGSLFAGLLLSYYVYSSLIFGFFPAPVFIRWGIIALCSPLAATMVWFSRKGGWSGAFCAGLPVGLLLVMGMPFLYLRSVVHGVDLAGAILLVFVLSSHPKERLVVGLMGASAAFVIRYSNLLVFLFGGL